MAQALARAQAHLGGAELPQDDRVPRGRWRFAEGPAQARDGVLHRPLRGRRARRAQQRLDHPVASPGRGQQQVRSHLFGRAAFGGDQLRRRGVQPAALARAQLVVHRGADDRMGELERRPRDEHVRGREPVGRVRDLAVVERGQRRRLRPRGSGAEHGDRRDERGRRRREREQP